MSEIKTKISTYNDVVDLFGEEKAADMLSEALDWSTINPKNDKKNIMERKPLLLDPYMTYEDEDYCKHIVAEFLGDRDLDWASEYIDEEKIKNGQVKVPSYVAYERPADIGTTIIDELCASQGTAVEKLVNYPTTKFERTMRDELFEALAVNETTISLMAKVPSSVFLDAVACMDSRYMSGHTVDTGHAFIVSPGTYEPYIGIHDPVYGAGYMMVDLDKPFEIPMNRIWIAMDDYSGPETKEGLRGMYHSPQDVSAFSDPFSGSVSVTSTRDEKQEPAKSGLEAKRDACALSAAHLDSPNTEIPNGKNMERE